MDEGRRLIAFDIESTGLNPFQDRIIELSFVDCETKGEIFYQLFDPGVRIPPGAQEVHGITSEDVADKPLFAARAEEIQGIVSDCTLLGYGSEKFDSLLLDAELQRAGQTGVPLSRTEDIDLLEVWQSKEPRNLEGAVRRFLDRHHEYAHRATADAKVLPDLLEAMASVWGLTLGGMSRLTTETGLEDRAQNLRWDERLGQLVFGFGKYKGEPVADHPEYLDWMLEADFPSSTKRIIRILQKNNFQLPGRGET